MGSEVQDWNFFTWKARIIPTVSGTASLLFSALGMSIILRSSSFRRELGGNRDNAATGLTVSHPIRASSGMSPYHRIMFFMFFWDIVSSTAIALTVFPMPSDVQETYPFPGKAYGNATTCSLQGLMIAGGQFFAVYANCVLNVYYVCTLRYGMSTEKINGRMLPIMFIVSVFISFPVFFLILYLGLFNPRRHEPYCYIGSYPENCNSPESKVECIGKYVSLETEFLVQSVFMILLGFAFLLVVVSMILVVITAFKAELQQIETEAIVFDLQHSVTGARFHADENSSEGLNDGTIEDGEKDNNLHSNANKKKKFNRTRTVVFVATMYIFAFLITWIWTLISVSKFISKEDGLHLSQASWDLIGNMKLCFTPFQGVFNSLIFIYNKAEDLRNTSPEQISFYDAVRIVIIAPASIPEVIIARVDMVDKDLVYRENGPGPGPGPGPGAGVGNGAGDAPSEDFDDFEISDNDTPDLNHSHALSRSGIEDDAFDRKEDFKKGLHHVPTRKHYKNIQYLQKGSPYLTRVLSDRFPTSGQIGGDFQGNSGQLSSDKMETPSDNSSDLLSQDKSRNGIGSFSMNSLLSGFSSVLTPQKKGDDLETREIQTQSGHVHPDNFEEDDNSQFYR